MRISRAVVKSTQVNSIAPPRVLYSTRALTCFFGGGSPYLAKATTGVCVGFTSMLLVTSTILQMKRQVGLMIPTYFLYPAPLHPSPL